MVLVAAGAILVWAVNRNFSGVNIHTVGWILFVVGLAGAIISLMFWSSWAGPGYWVRRRTPYIDDRPAPPAP